MYNIYQLLLKWVLNAKAALFVTACTVYILLIYFLSDALSGLDTSLRWEIIVFVVVIIWVAIYALNRITISEQRYRSLYDCHVEAIVTFNLKGQIININQQCEHLFGYSLDHYLNNKWEQSLDKTQLEKLGQFFIETLSGKSLYYETKFLHKLGYQIEVSTTLVPMMTNNKVVGVYALCKDITALNQHKTEIKHLHEHYQLLLNSVTEGIVGVGKDGRINFWNRTAEKMLGWTVDGAVQHSFINKLCQCRSCFDDVGKLSNMSICKGINQSLLDGKHREIDEVLLYRKDFSTFPASIVISPTIQYDGVQTGIVCTFKDITNYKKTEELLRKSDRLAAAGQLAAGVAHEIRNPLTALKGFLKLFPKNNFKEHNYISIMECELHRIESIVSEFLFVAKPNTNVFALHSLESILSETIELLNIQAITNMIKITMNIESRIPSILCDAHQLKQVFINIMKNAIESISEEGGNISIHVSHVIEHNQIKIEFHDTGCGISPDRIEHLGEPFYSTKEKGTGLGLMVTYKIIESHGGSMIFNSQLNSGTQVTIYLPITPREELRKD